MTSGLGSLFVLVGRDPQQLVDLPVVARDELLASAVPAVTADGIGWDPQRGELWFAGETAEAVLLELDARRRELHDEVEQLAPQAVEAGERAVGRTRAGRRGRCRRSRRSRICAAFGVRSRRGSSGWSPVRQGSMRP